MDPQLHEVFNSVAPSQDTAMHVPEGSVTSHWGTVSRNYFYFTTATLALCLIFAVATIMVLVVQKTGSSSITNLGDSTPYKGENGSENIFSILKNTSFKKSWAYLQASEEKNGNKLSWNPDGNINGVEYKDGDLVIQFPGLYFIICQLQFYLPQCPGHPVDLRLEIYINKECKKMAMVTVCESQVKTEKIYQNLSQFLLEDLQVNNTISIKVSNNSMVDRHTFPLQNVLSVFLYSDSK
ncbi:tumor necrosis factor ligand superfamily member 8 [Echinops telfairi]|uniref:Tumor necrosis factor ligand superfamily member 8 n=1 Tax=Echinops telfairi TaxID=9371 RepID=A0ABM0J199_ECHTE|nr:tumor necrosis factor ligand superfamily member 8 [Echinops telfairi]